MKKRIIVLIAFIILITNFSLNIYLKKFYEENYYGVVKEDLLNSVNEIEYTYNSSSEKLQYLKKEHREDVYNRLVNLKENILTNYSNLDMLEQYLEEYNENSAYTAIVTDGSFNEIYPLKKELSTLVKFVSENNNKETSTETSWFIRYKTSEIFVSIDRVRDKIVIIQSKNIDFGDNLEFLQSFFDDYIQERIKNDDLLIKSYIFDRNRNIGISDNKSLSDCELSFYNNYEGVIKKNIGKFFYLDKYCKDDGVVTEIFAYGKLSSDDKIIIISYVDNDEIKSHISKSNDLILTFNLISTIFLLIIALLLHDMFNIGSRW